MRIEVAHARVDPAEVRALVRFAFDLADADLMDVEVHVHRAEHIRVSWRIVCDGTGHPRNWIGGHIADTARAAAAACPAATRRDAVKVVSAIPASNLFSGTAYAVVPDLASVARGTRYLVTLKLPDPDVDGFPYEWRYHRAKTAVAPTIETWREAVVYLAGHEARHVRQYVADLPHSEVDAEATALAVLRRYRERER